MTKWDKRNPSYEWVTLKPWNIDYVAGVTGRSKEELKQILRTQAQEGKHQVEIPIGTSIFTRRER